MTASATLAPTTPVSDALRLLILHAAIAHHCGISTITGTLATLSTLLDMPVTARDLNVLLMAGKVVYGLYGSKFCVRAVKGV